ncbi:serine hydrolase domain-containing protein [Sphingobium fluviale]|uniref:Class C beta-lactamase-related serine hydrolase n=1 Tax=Sphingobium fluviale TaxID=2506423 RepID=A0A4Q1KJF5_9SPHN|nr:serine hydrolase [Sphingobium fluviale]RXR28734.1 class C beta-lactamase-related serine hydrolase [Sphingobium fluviale]
MNSKKWIAASVLLLFVALAAGALWQRYSGTQNAPLPPSDIARYRTLVGSGGISAQQIADAAEGLFDEDSSGATQAFIMMRDGKIVAERYGEGIGPQTKLLSRSIAKTVTATLIGLMVSDGRLALDSPAPVPAWNQPGDPRGAITLRNLLQMASGLEHSEDGPPRYNADTVRMIFTDGASDMAAYAEAKPVAHPPGTHFTYSTADSMILSDMMTRMLTAREGAEQRRTAMMEFVRGRLMTPVGLSSLTPEFDPHGTMIGGAMMHMTARDYARFGEFLRNKGRVNGHQVLSARWVEFMTTPSALNAAYGGHIWLNREGEGNPLFPGRGSRRIFAAVGHHGQYLLIDPTRRLVILRMGISNDEQYLGIRRALVRLVEMFPQG